MTLQIDAVERDLPITIGVTKGQYASAQVGSNTSITLSQTNLFPISPGKLVLVPQSSCSSNSSRVLDVVPESSTSTTLSFDANLDSDGAYNMLFCDPENATNFAGAAGDDHWKPHRHRLAHSVAPTSSPASENLCSKKCDYGCKGGENHCGCNDYNTYTGNKTHAICADIVTCAGFASTYQGFSMHADLTADPSY